MAVVKLAPNVATEIEVKYTDLVDGQYGAQVRFKGTVNGQDAMIFVRDIDGVNALIAAGLLATPPAYTAGNLGKGLSLGIGGKRLTLLNKQNAGEKYPTLTIANGAGAAHAASVAPAPAPQPKMGTLPGDQYANPAPLTAQNEWVTLRARYAECVEYVLYTIVPHLETAKVGASPESVAAMSATLFIARRDMGV